MGSAALRTHQAKRHGLRDAASSALHLADFGVASSAGIDHSKLSVSGGRERRIDRLRSTNQANIDVPIESQPNRPACEAPVPVVQG